MPKSQFIDSRRVFQPGYVHFEDIPVNQYEKTAEEEKTLYTKADMLRIYRDMRIIREFETMQQEIKVRGVYHGIEYHNPGPAHLALGQEATAVGGAYALDVCDLSFGSHRNHGEVLAKGLVSIHKLGDDELYEIMKNYLGGAILRAVEGRETAPGDTKELAVDFFLYGMLCELFAKSTGFNRGLGGSMHAFFQPFGIMPNNAIVGGAAPLALGAALYKRANKKQGIVVANFGDGACARGSVCESLVMSAMDQYRKLWGTTDGGNHPGLPLLFSISDNFYAMGGQTVGETMGFGMAARIGAGINPEQLHAERVNGYDPLAVIDAVSRQKKLLLDGKGPAMLDLVTYRTVGHSQSDPSTYRTAEEVESWQAVCPIRAFREKLIKIGAASEAELDALDESITERIVRITRMAVDEEISPRMDLGADPDAIASLMFSNERRPHMEEDRQPEVLTPRESNSRVNAIAQKARVQKARGGLDEDGKPVTGKKLYTFRDALFEAIFDKFYEDPTLIAYGEENRDWGGSNAVYRGMTESLPYHRLFNAPIAEAAIVGSAAGYAMCGGRVVAELMYADFIGCAADELFNQAAKWQAMSGGVLKMPMVLRVAVGSGYGAQHSQDWSSLAAHVAGLKIVCPATPYDAKGLMNTALSGTDPVVFFESQLLYGMGERFHPDGVPEGYYEIPFGEPEVKREGNDVTILSIGAALYRAMEAAELLAKQYGVSAEVIDARTIVPFDYEKVLNSVKKTGRIVIVGDACERGSIMKTMAADLTELAFDYLDAPPAALGARNWITPCRELDGYFFPQAQTILDLIHERLLPLPGYVPKRSFSDEERIRQAKEGV